MPAMPWKYRRPRADAVSGLLARLLCAGSLLAGLAACNPSAGSGPSPEQRATYLAMTAAVLLTATAGAGITPATPTPLPSDTPTSTPAPTETATSPPTPQPSDTPEPEPCEDHSTFVSDVNVPDGTHFAPGTAFVKTWRLNNSGDCTWTTDYQLRHISGNAMGAAVVNLPHNVPPGANVDISVSLVAPASNGTHRGQFQLHSPSGEPFGTRPFVEIIVP
jgi:hypothetical protein